MEGLINKFKHKKFPPMIKSPVTRVQLTQYAGASGDFNPIHIDEVFARKSPLGGVIAHGMLSMGFLGQYLEQLAGYSFEIEKFKVQFRSIVRPGDTITCEAEVKEITDKVAVLHVQAKNQEESLVVKGEAVIREK